ncbi:Hypothetical predicted protein [Octopus vulgaris]|uniref:Uncharacterized protein n=1 Tax=Octopus vulgaris TaxID=6645 RepID=A0AA36BPL2_OCTVU|nr:Hypothetical predicted protein [Octopus vulgaris]
MEDKVEEAMLQQFEEVRRNSGGSNNEEEDDFFSGVTQQKESGSHRSLKDKVQNLAEATVHLEHLFSVHIHVLLHLIDLYNVCEYHFNQGCDTTPRLDHNYDMA